jgi:hypothetical protein
MDDFENDKHRDDEPSRHDREDEPEPDSEGLDPGLDTSGDGESADEQTAGHDDEAELPINRASSEKLARELKKRGAVKTLSVVAFSGSPTKDAQKSKKHKEMLREKGQGQKNVTVRLEHNEFFRELALASTEGKLPWAQPSASDPKSVRLVQKLLEQMAAADTDQRSTASPKDGAVARLSEALRRAQEESGRLEREARTSAEVAQTAEAALSVVRLEMEKVRNQARTLEGNLKRAQEKLLSQKKVVAQLRVALDDTASRARQWRLISLNFGTALTALIFAIA